MLKLSAFTLAILKTVSEWAGFGSQSTLSGLCCKLNIMQTSCNSEKRLENGGLLRCDFVTLFQKGQGR